MKTQQTPISHQERMRNINRNARPEVYAKLEGTAPAQAQHSPLPWKNRSEANETLLAFIYDADGKMVASLKHHDWHSPQKRAFKTVEANAALIVRACNNAQRLADELSLIVRTVNDTLRHGLTVAQEEALTDCAKSSFKALEDFRKQSQ